MQDSTHSIFHSALRFFTGTMISRVTGLMRDIVMAFVFGTNSSVAALMVAFRWSHLLRRLLGEGALQTAFIPQFEKLRAENPLRAYRFFQDLCTWLVVTLACIVTGTMAVLWGFLHFGKLSPGNHEIIYLTFLMMPGLLFICLYGLNSSLLQCEHYYFTASAAPIAFNILWIAGVLSLWNAAPQAAMTWLSCFIIVACAGEWFMTVPQTIRILRKGGGINPLRSMNLTSIPTDLKLLIKPLFLGMIGVGATQINNAMDTLFARYADPEGPAYLWYSIRLQQLPLALFGIALSGALLPPLSRAIKNLDYAKFHTFLDFAVRRSLALMLPVTAALLVLGDTCINLIYGRGSFDVHSVIGTTQCLWAYTLGLIPMTLLLILAPAFYAQNDYRNPSRTAVASMIINIILNAFLVAVMGLGAASVAIATSVSAWINCGILAYVLSNKLGTITSQQMWESVGKVFLATLTACCAVLIGNAAAGDGNNAWRILIGETPLLSRGFEEQITLFIRQSVCFILGLALAAWALKAEDLLQLVKGIVSFRRAREV